MGGHVKERKNKIGKALFFLSMRVSLPSLPISPCLRMALPANGSACQWLPSRGHTQEGGDKGQRHQHGETT